MKIKDCKCAASLNDGVLTLEDGTVFNLDLVYETLADLRDYAVEATLDSDELPPCVRTATKLLFALKQLS